MPWAAVEVSVDDVAGKIAAFVAQMDGVGFVEIATDVEREAKASVVAVRAAGRHTVPFVHPVDRRQTREKVAVEVVAGPTSAAVVTGIRTGLRAVVGPRTEQGSTAGASGQGGRDVLSERGTVR
jgi:hypothetical protein